MGGRVGVIMTMFSPLTIWLFCSHFEITEGIQELGWSDLVVFQILYKETFLVINIMVNGDSHIYYR